MAQDTLLGFPAHTLPYRRGEFTTLLQSKFYRRDDQFTVAIPTAVAYNADCSDKTR